LVQALPRWRGEDHVVNAEVAFYAFWVKMTTIVSAIVLLLSLVPSMR
jgi:hypothetical protein